MLLNPNAVLVLQTGTSKKPIKAGQGNVFKVQPADRYRVLRLEEGQETLADNVVARRVGDHLNLAYADGTVVQLEAYFSVCKSGECDVTLPSQASEGFQLNAQATNGTALGDGSSLIYAHGSPDVLLEIAQGNSPLQNVFANLSGNQITYLPAPVVSVATVATAEPTAAVIQSQTASALGGLNYGLIAGGGLALAAVGGGGGGSASASVVNFISGNITAGPVIAGNGLTVNLYQVDGTTLLGSQTVSDSGSFSINVGSYSGPVICKLVDSGTGADFIDEATGQALDISADMMAIAVAGSGTTTVNINALTTIAAQKAGAVHSGESSGTITAALITQTNTAVASAFGLTDLTGSSVVTTVDTTGAANAAFTSSSLTNATKYGAVLAALSGLDSVNGGNMQITINTLVAGISVSGASATLTTTVTDAITTGATIASANAVGTGAASLTSIVSDLTAQTNASVSINRIATDGVISASEHNTTLSGTTVAGASVSLSLGGNARAATVVGTNWTYGLTDADVAAMGQGSELITATATLSGSSTATAQRSVVVDSLGPTVSNVAISTATDALSNTLNAGDILKITVTMSEGTLVTGVPQLSINVGGTTVVASYASGSGTPTWFSRTPSLPGKPI